MSTFTKCAAPTTTGSCDPTRHVFFNPGMVLGVDDFNQEFSYLSGHDQWMTRDLNGYGTTLGLRVIAELDVKGPRVVVSPGVAVSPCGQMIRVPTAQCAYLNEWLKLETTKQELISHAGSPPATIRAYLVLCYRDCPTDNVPIPGEPCRSEDDLMAPSRLADDFTLELRLEAPGQREEDAIRDYVAWLSAITVSDSGPSSSLTEFLDAIRTAAHLFSSPPDAGSGPLPDYLYESPPSTLVINNAQLCEYLDAAFRLWVTELRPRFRPDFLAGAHCCSNTSNGSKPEVEECLLLAEVDVPVIIPEDGTDWQVDNPDHIAIDETRRPVVVHLRMLQEMLLCGRSIRAAGSSPGGSGPVTLAGDANGPVAATVVTGIQGVPVAPISGPKSAAMGQVLTFDGATWAPAPIAVAPASITPGAVVTLERQFDQLDSVGLATTAYARADHTHGTPDHPIPPHLLDTAGHNAHLVGQIGGDVTGTIGSATLSKLQNKPVQASNPSERQVLTFLDGVWKPATPTGGSGGTGSGNLTSIVALSWTHGGVSSDLFPVERLGPDILSVPPRNLGIVLAFGPSGAKPTDTTNLTKVKFGPAKGADGEFLDDHVFLDEHSFQIFILEPTQTSTVYRKLVVGRLPVAGLPEGPNVEMELIPVSVTLAPNGALRTASEISSAAAVREGTHGVAIVCDRGFLDKNLLIGRERKIFVEVRGDLITDLEHGLAVDCNFLGGQLPTGNKTPGGRFWSWFTVPVVVPPDQTQTQTQTADASVSDAPARLASARPAPAGARKKPVKKKPSKKKTAKKTS